MRHLLYLAAAALLSVAGPAGAADLYSNGSTKDPSAVTPGTNGIVGPYVEIATGFGFSSNNISLLNRDVSGAADLSSDGALLNGRLGYDYRLPGSHFGVGVYGEVGDNFDVNGSASALGSGVKWGENWTWGGGGKLFYDHGLGQIYVLGGYVGTNEVITPTGSDKITKTLDGAEWGAGISLKLAGNVYGKLEFNQIIYADEKLGSGTAPTWKQVDDRVLFGLGYSFGSALSSLK